MGLLRAPRTSSLNLRRSASSSRLVVSLSYTLRRLGRGFCSAVIREQGKRAAAASFGTVFVPCGHRFQSGVFPGVDFDQTSRTWPKPNRGSFRVVPCGVRGCQRRSACAMRRDARGPRFAKAQFRASFCPCDSRVGCSGFCGAVQGRAANWRIRLRKAPRVRVDGAERPPIGIFGDGAAASACYVIAAGGRRRMRIARRRAPRPRPRSGFLVILSAASLLALSS